MLLCRDTIRTFPYNFNNNAAKTNTKTRRSRIKRFVSNTAECFLCELCLRALSETGTFIYLIGLRVYFGESKLNTNLKF